MGQPLGGGGGLFGQPAGGGLDFFSLQSGLPQAPPGAYVAPKTVSPPSGCVMNYVLAGLCIRLPLNGNETGLYTHCAWCLFVYTLYLWSLSQIRQDYIHTSCYITQTKNCDFEHFLIY